MAKTAPLPKPAPKKKRGQLAEIQRLMAQVVSRPLTRSEGIQRTWVDGTPTSAVAASFIQPNDRLTALQRLEIYNQQYWWRLLGCFGDDFRGLRAVLGERKFDRLAVAYLEAHGSTSWSLRDLGQHLPAFLEAHPELTAPHEALALEMARIEWAKILAFDTAALPVVDPQKIAGRDPSKVRLKLQPYITLIQVRHPVDFLLKKVREANIETGSASNAVGGRQRKASRFVRCKPADEPIHLAVHRVDFSVYYKRLEPEAFALLSALRTGASLDEACGLALAQAKGDDETMATKVGEWFNVWMRLGWLA